jgi:hypothetical protein
VENHPGAGGNLGADVVAKSAPDGYTILQTTNGQAISPALYRALPFDAVADFVPVTQLVASTLVLVAGASLPVASTGELIALARSRPGKLNYGSSGVGNPLHLTMEMIKFAAGIDIEPVPYRGDAQINTALMAGEVEVELARLLRRRPHAARHRRPDPAGDREGPAGPGPARAPGRAKLRAGRQHAGGVRRLLQVRARALRRRGEAGPHSAAGLSVLQDRAAWPTPSNNSPC